MRAGDRKISATHSRQSTGMHYQAIGADSRQNAAIVDWVGRQHVYKGRVGLYVRVRDMLTIILFWVWRKSILRSKTIFTLMFPVDLKTASPINTDTVENISIIN